MILNVSKPAAERLDQELGGIKRVAGVDVTNIAALTRRIIIKINNR
jgi:hypothetical protein